MLEVFAVNVTEGEVPTVISFVALPHEQCAVRVPLEVNENCLNAVVRLPSYVNDPEYDQLLKVQPPGSKTWYVLFPPPQKVEFPEIEGSVPGTVPWASVTQAMLLSDSVKTIDRILIRKRKGRLIRLFLQRFYLLLQFNDVEGELFDFLHQLCIHFADTVILRLLHLPS